MRFTMLRLMAALSVISGGAVLAGEFGPQIRFDERMRGVRLAAVEFGAPAAAAAAPVTERPAAGAFKWAPVETTGPVGKLGPVRWEVAMGSYTSEPRYSIAGRPARDWTVAARVEIRF